MHLKGFLMVSTFFFFFFKTGRKVHSCYFQNECLYRHVI